MPLLAGPTRRKVTSLVHPTPKPIHQTAAAIGAVSTLNFGYHQYTFFYQTVSDPSDFVKCFTLYFTYYLLLLFLVLPVRPISYTNT